MKKPFLLVSVLVLLGSVNFPIYGKNEPYLVDINIYNWMNGQGCQ